MLRFIADVIAVDGPNSFGPATDIISRHASRTGYGLSHLYWQSNIKSI